MTHGITELTAKPCNYCNNPAVGKLFIWGTYVFFCEGHRKSAEAEMELYEDDKANNWIENLKGKLR